MNTVAVAINLPTSASPHDFVTALSQAQYDHFSRGDMVGGHAIQQLLNLVHCAVAYTAGPMRTIGSQEQL